MSSVAHDVALVESLGSEIGLSLNRSKCKLISDSFPDILPPCFQGFKLMHPRDVVLLGAPLMDGAAMDSVLRAKCEDLQRASDRMSYISSHDSLVILKNSLGSTRVQYILRALPCASHPALVRFDELQRAILGRISNCELTDRHWMQVNLPVRCGGWGYVVWCC